MRRNIKWEKWVDPLLSNYEDAEWPGFDQDKDGNAMPIHTVERQPVLHTPHGMISVVASAMASNRFDFWLMYTNFGLEEDIASAIELVPGVETLEITTRYTARVGFPRSGFWQPRDVMHQVLLKVRELAHIEQDETLIGLDEETFKKVVKTREQIEEKFDNWAIWLVPNGNVEVLGAETIDKNYRERLSLLKEAHGSVGGRFLTSESE